ncbi:MAG TPA: hypothetical protein VIL31_08525 [Cyclobacteriaceae bacterium]|jgi:hypothetical protein
MVRGDSVTLSMKDFVQFIIRFWFLILVVGLFVALLWMAAFG